MHRSSSDASRHRGCRTFLRFSGVLAAGERRDPSRAAAHFRYFACHVGDIAGVARAKAELIEALPSSGTAILNGDQPLVAGMRTHTHADVLTFGTSPGLDVRVRDVVLDEQARPRFTLDTPRGAKIARTARAACEWRAMAQMARGGWVGG